MENIEGRPALPASMEVLPLRESIIDPISLAMGLAQFAPGIIKLMTGSDKASEIANKVVEVAKSVTGSKTGTAAVVAIQADPDKILAFREAMVVYQVGLERMYLEDKQDARAMQVAALGQEDLFSKRFVYLFAACWSVFSMAYATLVTFYMPASPEGKGIAQTVLGFLLGTAVASIFSYFFGSTKGSAEKNKLLAESIPAKL